MTSIAETPVFEDANIKEDHIRSPFQLSRPRERPVKLVSLSQNITAGTATSPTTTATQNNNDRELFGSVSSTDSAFEPTSPKSATSIGSSPFSLSIKKVSKSSVSSTAMSPILSPSALSSTNLITNGSSHSQDKTADLLKEVNTLKKDIEAKDAKLSSSLKSIKQFWSPELKKERAARKEETEKCLVLKDKYQIATSQIEVSMLQ